MIRRDWSERPAAKAYEDLVLHQWWTREDLRTAADGAAHSRAFYGDYTITATLGSHTASTAFKLVPAGNGAVELRLAR